MSNGLKLGEGSKKKKRSGLHSSVEEELKRGQVVGLIPRLAGLLQDQGSDPRLSLHTEVVRRGRLKQFKRPSQEVGVIDADKG